MSTISSPRRVRGAAGLGARLLDAVAVRAGSALRPAGARYRARQCSRPPLLLSPGPAGAGAALQPRGRAPMTTILRILVSPRPQAWPMPLTRIGSSCEPNAAASWIACWSIARRQRFSASNRTLPDDPDARRAEADGDLAADPGRENGFDQAADRGRRDRGERDPEGCSSRHRSPGRSGGPETVSTTRRRWRSGLRRWRYPGRNFRRRGAAPRSRRRGDEKPFLSGRIAMAGRPRAPGSRRRASRLPADRE